MRIDALLNNSLARDVCVGITQPTQKRLVEIKHLYLSLLKRAVFYLAYSSALFEEEKLSSYLEHHSFMKAMSQVVDKLFIVYGDQNSLNKLTIIKRKFRNV